jgi:hypothetical protein
LITSDQYDLFGASLKTSKDTSALDSEKLLATWKAQVIKQRGEYSARLKSAHLTRENESISWPTVRVSSANGASQKELQAGNPKRRLETEVLLHPWPTPSARDHKGGYQGGRIRNGKASFDTLDVAVQHYSGDKNKVGHLNPDWVEWLMGVPTGWTELGSWGTE